jgi:hypothetical protein
LWRGAPAIPVELVENRHLLAGGNAAVDAEKGYGGIVHLLLSDLHEAADLDFP